MASPPIEPRSFDNTSEWYKSISRQWQFREPVDLACAIEPNIVQAASGHTFVITCLVGPELTLPAGAHITLEIRATWDAYLGNCFRRGIRTVGNRQQINAGYGAWTDVESSNPGVGLDWSASYGRHLDLVDIVITQGALGPGDTLTITLGPPDGNLVQAQKYEQVAILPIAVDLLGDGAYRCAKTFPEVKVIGAWPDRLRVFAPGVVTPGEAFIVRVMPVDIYSYNRATGYQGTIEVLADKGVAVAPSVFAVDSEVQPNGGAVAAKAIGGVHYVTAIDRRSGLAGRSNPIGAGFLEDRGIYFGELHSQMWHSMGTGTTAEFFEWGRGIAGLDFCAPANHYNWRFEVTDEIWQDLVDACNAYNEPGRFATLVSYEWGGSSGSGHKNVYYRGDSGEFSYFYRSPTDADKLWASLEGRDVLTIPHHSKAMGGTDWHYRNDAHQRLVEICSNWGIAETAGPRSVQAALAMGHRLGFVGGTDSHYGLANQGSYHVNDGNGLACVMATELDRDAIWQALYDRRCYATTGDRILLDFSMDGHPLGSDISADLGAYGPRAFTMRVAGTYRIDSVEVIRNNQVVYAVEPGVEVWEGEWLDQEPLLPLAFEPTFRYDRPFVYYYLRVTLGNRQQAWSSPIWLTQGE